MLVDKLTVGADESRSHVRDGEEWQRLVAAALAGDPAALASLWSGAKRWITWLTVETRRRRVVEAEAIVLGYAWEALAERPADDDRWFARTRTFVRAELRQGGGRLGATRTVPVGDIGGWVAAGRPGCSVADEAEAVVDRLAASAAVASLCRRRAMTPAAKRYADRLLNDSGQGPADPVGRRAFVQWRASVTERVA